MKSKAKVLAADGFISARPLFAVAGALSSLPGAAENLNVARWFCPHCNNVVPSVGPTENTASPADELAAGSAGSSGAGVGLDPGVPALEQRRTVIWIPLSPGVPEPPISNSQIFGLTAAVANTFATGKVPLLGVVTLEQIE